ncbi:MAG TPA: penicillin-binding protein 2 [Mycobacteriales bacterium]|nr:penicillin-binding protein 2 [Mycobacteriales bacterium]
MQFILIGCLIVLSLIGGRLVQLQGLDGTAYAKMAEKQRLHTVALTAPRGPILDRDGQPLAETVDARDIYADPSKVVDAAAEAAALGPVLGVPAAGLQSQLEQHTTFVYLARAVTPALATKVMDLKLPSSGQGPLPGIGVLPTTKRIYPAGTLASNVVGFANADGTGLAGLEYSFQQQLAGRNGKRTFETGLSGSPIPDGQDVVQPAVPGSGLQLTIHRDIQWEAQQALTRQVKAVHADSGTVIVMNPTNGQLLALAVAPGFDPNDPGKSPMSAFGDPAVSEVYEPGSVNKVITMSAALQEGIATPTSPYVIPPVLHYAGFPFHDAEVHGTEHLTLTGILAKSSNIGTIEVARKLGAARLYHYLRAFGFGAPTGVKLPGDGTGILPSLGTWTPSTLPTVSFGQGVGVTALQVASVYATIANGGVRVQPNLIAGTVGPNGTVTPAPKPERHRVISARVAGQVRDMLEAVTSNEGTAPLARIPGYRIAGKTGTAQRPVNGGYSGYTSSFVGFGPADAPKLLVEVVLQNPRNGHFGGLVAAPVFHDVMSFALQTLKIPPTGTKPPRAKLHW